MEGEKEMRKRGGKGRKRREENVEGERGVGREESGKEKRGGAVEEDKGSRGDWKPRERDDVEGKRGGEGIME